MSTRVITLARTCDTDLVAARLKEQLLAFDLQVKTWVELNDFYEKTVALYKGQFARSAADHSRDGLIKRHEQCGHEHL